MDVGEIIHTQHAFGCGGLIKEEALWESEAARHNVINIIEVMQMVRRRGALWRKTIVNGYFCCN